MSDTRPVGARIRRVVYSTCSIADVENDRVVERALERAGAAAVRVVQDPAEGGVDGVTLGASDLADLGAERTRQGWILLPDKSRHGPIYVCVLERTGEPHHPHLSS